MHRWFSSHHATKLVMTSCTCLCHMCNAGCLVGEILEVAAVRVITEVWCVECEEERREHCTLWSSCPADYHIRHTVTDPHILWSVCEVVGGPCSQVAVDSRSFQLHPELWWVDCVESTGEVKKHDSYSTPSALQVWKWPVQQVDCSIIHTNARSLSKLQRVHLAVHRVSQVVENVPIHGLHKVRGQSH